MLPLGELGWDRTSAPSSPPWQGLPASWHTALMVALGNLTNANKHIHALINAVQTHKPTQRQRDMNTNNRSRVTGSYFCSSRHQKTNVCLCTCALACLLTPLIPAESTPPFTHTHINTLCLAASNLRSVGWNGAVWWRQGGIEGNNTV